MQSGGVFHGQAHNDMQRHLVVRMWQRTAWGSVPNTALGGAEFGVRLPLYRVPAKFRYKHVNFVNTIYSHLRTPIFTTPVGRQTVFAGPVGEGAPGSDRDVPFRS